MYTGGGEATSFSAHQIGPKHTPGNGQTVTNRLRGKYAVVYPIKYTVVWYPNPTMSRHRKRNNIQR